MKRTPGTAKPDVTSTWSSTQLNHMLRELAGQLAGLRRDVNRGVRRRQVIVTATSPGPPPTLTIAFEPGGPQVPGVAYLASYTPGQLPETVWALRDGTDYLVLGPTATGPPPAAT